MFRIHATPSVLFNANDIVLDGNSLIDYMRLPANTVSYEQLGSPGRTKINFGVAGQTTTQMQADASTQIDTLNPVNKTLIVWEVLNDVFFGASSVQAFANIKQYCAARKAKGWTVLLLTAPATLNGGIQARLNEVDTQILNTWQEWVNGVVHVKNIAELANAARADMYYDNVHLSNAGYTVLYRHINHKLRNLRK